MLQDKLESKHSLFSFLTGSDSRWSVLVLFSFFLFQSTCLAKEHRWGGTTDDHMGQLHQMEENHHNFVQNYYRSDNKYNQKLHKEVQMLEQLTLLKQQNPQKFKQMVQKLQKGDYGDNVNIADRYLNYVDSKKSNFQSRTSRSRATVPRSRGTRRSGSK